MAVHTSRSTLMGGITPMCNECGVAMCWDISNEEYISDKQFWDKWLCQSCLLISRLDHFDFDVLQSKHSKTLVQELIDRVRDKNIKKKLITLLSHYN